MKKIKWNVLIITCVVTLLPILFGMSVWNQLPEQIAIHFDLYNQPDNFAPKWIAVFGLPLMMAGFQVFCCLVTDFQFQRYSGHKKMEQVSKWVIPLISGVLYFVTLGYGLGWEIDIRRIAICIVGILFVVLGNYLPKLSYVKNYNFEPEVAKKINRFMGFGMVIMGILGLISVLLPPAFSMGWLILLISFGVISSLYAIWLGKKHQTQS